MNPIAILAFLTGIGTSTPPAPKPTEKDQTHQQEKPTHSGKDQGQAKRGGWDRN
ncbi:MAG: hypothetical protein IPJ87_00700 [Flavobacteriales bacterium]|jgi:hypothetical protein|nr:hypothetical protein [Flavobacteriales bacterium]MBK7940394.1 hypothetical protein [Flavobacteriales bacterium]MBK8950119.1 hypothetical protein [Flavobacteriales bacterium]MBK9699446.1 hypothetical protein [Flavobacteriales bacterium]